MFQLPLPDPTNIGPSLSSLSVAGQPTSPHDCSPSTQPIASASFSAPPPSRDGISDTLPHQHSRSSSIPVSSPSSPAEPFHSRQLPPGASYAPDPSHRATPSLPNVLDLFRLEGASPGGSPSGASGGPHAAHALSASVGRARGAGLEMVAESASTHTGPERREEGGGRLSPQQARRPLPVPQSHQSEGLLSSPASRTGPSFGRGSGQCASPPSPALAGAPYFPPPEAYYSPTSASQPRPAHSLHTPLSTSASAPPPLHQRNSFVGIPGGRVPSTRSASDAAERASNIPSFVPAAAFSAADRGPYPPHQPSFSRSLPAGGEQSELLSPEAQRLSAGGMGGLSPFSADGRPGSLAFDMPDDMAGIGRNSIIRAAAASPGPTTVQQQGQQTSPPRPGGTGPKSPQLVGPSLQALQAAPQQAQPGEPYPPVMQTTFPKQPQPQQLPPHLVPQPEVCVECMMRDRDMADVNVTGTGVWERESDVEFEDQMRWEAEQPASSQLAPPGGSGGESWSGEHGSGSQESGMHGMAGSRTRRTSGAGYSRESLGGRSSNYHGGGGRKRLGKGQALTSGNLKVLTTMNPPAAAHRWRTLQTFLATQIHLIELERQAREAAEREQQVALARSTASSMTNTRNRTSSLLSPASLAAEKAALEEEDRRARSRTKNRSRSTLGDETNRYSSAPLHPASSPIPIGPPHPPFAGSGISIRSYSAGDQPWLGNPLRRLSSAGIKEGSPPKSPAASTASSRFNIGKFARSTTDLRSVASPRSLSPSRTSVGLDDRRTSMWSRFRQSASASVLSFAPSGSMMDMHLGLSQDKHMPYPHHAPYETYPSMSDPAVARHAEQLERDRALAASGASGGGDGAQKKKKKGIKGFFNKLVGGSGKKGHSTSASAPATPAGDAPYAAPFDDDELAPPPPLSALANEPRYHQRSASNSSVDSLGPYTPPLHPTNFRTSYNMPMPEQNRPTDRHSIMTLGSVGSTRSRPPQGPNAAPPGSNGRTTAMSRYSVGRPSLDSLHEPMATKLPRIGSPEPLVVDAQSEPEVLADDEIGGAKPISLSFPQPRLQKSLPSLPSDAMYHPQLHPSQDAYPTLPAAASPYAQYPASRSAYSLAQSASRGEDDFGGEGDDRRTLDGSTASRKSRSRPKVFSMIGSFGKKSKAHVNAPPVPSPPPSIGGNGRRNSLDAALALGERVPYDARDAVNLSNLR
ncbi:hypothetical protein JCM11641_001904 [Rhodosporidiobolus odoratus]